MCHWSFYHILTSSVIYYWTYVRQHGIYLLNKPRAMLAGRTREGFVNHEPQLVVYLLFSSHNIYFPLLRKSNFTLYNNTFIIRAYFNFAGSSFRGGFATFVIYYWANPIFRPVTFGGLPLSEVYGSSLDKWIKLRSLSAKHKFSPFEFRTFRKTVSMVVNIITLISDKRHQFENFNHISDFLMWSPSSTLVARRLEDSVHMFKTLFQRVT